MDLTKLKSDVTSVFATDVADVTVAVHGDGDGKVRIEVSRSYSYLPLTFDILMKLSELFGTQEYTVNQWNSAGCATCNFGSVYAHVFTFTNKKEEEK